MKTIALVICLVVGVTDGDTLTARCDDSTIKVRLSDIDAPEKSQAFGQKSKQSLSNLCYLKKASLQVQSKDRYGRSVARVTCNGVDANAEQVKTGMVWVYDKYVTDHSLYALQDRARSKRLGVWSEHSPVPPWEYRKKK